MCHKRHRIPRPYGRAMGCLFWVTGRKGTARYREYIVPISTYLVYTYLFWSYRRLKTTLQWRHNHQPHDCLLNRLFGRRLQETSKLRVTGLCEGNSPVTGEFPTQRASNVENVSIWWRHHEYVRPWLTDPAQLMVVCNTTTWWTDVN